MRKSFRSGRFLTVAVAIYFAAGCGSTIMEQEPPESTGEAVKASSELRLADVQIRVGRTAFNQGSVGTALVLFEKAHQLAPKDARPLVGKGDVMFAQRRFGEAETAYRAALARDPGLFEAQEGLGKTLVSTQKYEEGLHALEAALAIRRDAALLNKIGVAHEMLGDGETAQKYYRESLVLQANSVTARNNLALSLSVSGSYDAALKEMEEVIQSPDANERHHANMAFIYGLSGRSMDQVPPRVANAAASKGWDEAFFVRTRAVAKSGNRTALLDLLNNRRPATPPSQSPPNAVLPKMPDSEPEPRETAETPAAAPMIVSRPDPTPGMTPAPSAAMAAVLPARDVTPETGASGTKSGSPTVLIAPPTVTAPYSARPATETEALPVEPAAEWPSRPDPTPGMTPAPTAAIATVLPARDVTAETGASGTKSGSPTLLIPPPTATAPDFARPATETAALAAESAAEQTAGPVDEPVAEQTPEQPAARSESVQMAMRTPANSGFDDPDSLGLEVPQSTAASVMPRGAFRVQLGAFKTTSGLSALIAKLGTAAVGMLPVNRLNVVFRKDLYLARSYGLPTRDAAQQLCTDLLARHVECFVSHMRDSSSGEAFDLVRAAEAGAVDRFIGALPKIKDGPKTPSAKLAADATIGDQPGATVEISTK